MQQITPLMPVKKRVSFADRDGYKQQTEAELRRWRHRMQEMGAAIETLSKDAQAKAKEYWQKLESDISRADEALRMLSEETWDDAQLRVEYAKEALEDTWAYWEGLTKK